MRYFICLVTEKGTFPDSEGSELIDLDEASREAALFARELTIEELRQGRPVPTGWQLRIQDSSRRTVRTHVLRDLVLERASVRLWREAMVTAASVNATQSEIRALIAETRQELRRFALLRPAR